MSIVITPGPTHLRPEPAPAGRLAASLLSVTVAGLADPQRFRRGKAYLADNAIARLELSEGVLLATVVGGRPDPYHVTVTVETVSRPEDLGQVPERAHVARLIPRADELLFSCTCPDWDDPCKHGVAATSTTGRARRSDRGRVPIVISGWCSRRLHRHSRLRNGTSSPATISPSRSAPCRPRR